MSAYERWVAEKYEPVNRCIYCGSTDNLSDEHIIPYGLQPRGGDWFLPKASCARCADITKRFEGLCLQGTLGPLRTKLNLKSRNKSKTSVETSINYREDGRIEKANVPIDDFPMVCIGFDWDAAGLLRHANPATEFSGTQIVRYPAGEIEKVIREGQAFKLGRVGQLEFARMLAKIAHSYAVAKFGEGAFEPLLPHLILGHDANAPYLIGGDRSGSPLSSQSVLHDVYPQACDVNGVPHLLVGIRLFAFMGMPRYLVVVGKMRGSAVDRLRTNPL